MALRHQISVLQRRLGATRPRSDPAPDRATTTWGAFLRSQADAILACNFLETVTLTGQRQYVPAVIEHTTRRIRIPGATAHPTAAWITQAARNLVMDLEDAGAAVRYLIRDHDAKFPPSSARSSPARASRWCSPGSGCRG